MFDSLRSTWRALRRRARWESELHDELRSHIEHRAADLIRSGIPPADAERRARLELGSGEAYKEECRRSYGLRWADETWQDLRYALRTLRRSPGFAAVAVLSLALGIGANIAVFGIIDALVLRPLPVRAPERLVFVEPMTHSFPTYRDLRDRNTTFEGLFAYRASPIGLGAGKSTARVFGYLVTGNYFDLLGARPLLGRFLHASDDTKPGGDPFVVLSYECWRNRFAADPAIVGQAIHLNGKPYTVLGVAPAGFQGTETILWPEVWVPMSMEPEIEQHAWLDNRSEQNCLIGGRLKPHVTAAQAEANLRAVTAELGREYPETDAGKQVRLSKLGLIGQSLRNPMEAFVFGVILLSGMVLLAACANLASLMAARGADRGFELAIRVSIGAARSRIVRQLMTESLVLAVVGGLAGCALATALLRGLGAVSLAEVPVRLDAAMNWKVLFFGLTAALLSALFFGIAPIRQAYRGSSGLALRGGAQASGGARGRTWPVREALLAAQVAICCVLVTACFVAIAGARRALEMPVGIQPRGVSVVGFDLGLARYSHKDGEAFQRRALEAVAHIPGVTAAAFSDAFPLGVDQNNNGVFRYGETQFRASNAISASHFNVSPGYLGAIGTRLVAGRDFNWRDSAEAPPVAIVNLTFARRVLGTEHGVGLYYRSGRTSVQVVGIVEDGKYKSIGEDPHPALFTPILQVYDGTTYLFTRSPRPEMAVAREMEGAIRDLDRGLPLYNAGPIGNLLDLAYFQARAAAWCLGAFGVLALMLAVTGIYGLSAYTVSRRVREIGIRVAIGASPRQVLRTVLGRMIAILMLGAIAGIAGGVACSAVLAHVVEQATPRDPIVLACVAATMILAALFSCWAPARRAISVDPTHSLRAE